LVGFIVATHAATMLAVLLGFWPGWVKAGCVLAVAASAAASFHRHLLNREVAWLERMRDGGWRLHLRDGREFKCELLGDSLMTPAFTLLVLSSAYGTRLVPIFRDSLDSETYRRLRVVLCVYGLLPPMRTGRDGPG
jgi:hypothetical protein